MQYLSNDIIKKYEYNCAKSSYLYSQRPACDIKGLVRNVKWKQGYIWPNSAPFQYLICSRAL